MTLSWCAREAGDRSGEEMQSFRPLQRRQGLGAGLTRTGGDRLIDWRPSDTNIDLGLDSGFLVYTLTAIFGQ